MLPTSHSRLSFSTLILGMSTRLDAGRYGVLKAVGTSMTWQHRHRALIACEDPGCPVTVWRSAEYLQQLISLPANELFADILKPWAVAPLVKEA